MPFQNEHSARVRDPKDFQSDSFRRKNIADGVDLITGKLVGDDSMAEQAYRFDTSKFSAEQAQKWCQDNEISIVSFEPAANDKIIEGHIFIYGEIVPFQDIQASEYGCVNLKNVVGQIKENKEANRLICHIHSPGGDVWEGFAIHDALVNSGKEVETIIEGLCASIATVIALAGDRRLMTQHSEFMIHNPWTFGIGDSEDLKKQSEELAKTETKLADFYSAKTNLSNEKLLEYMHEETFFTAEEAKEYGFITEVVKTMKQVASINKSNLQIMSNKKEQDEKLSVLDKLINRLESLFHKNIVISDVNGRELDFPELNDPSEIKEGAKVNEGGNPAEGEYQLADGRTLVCAGGVVSEIKPKEGDGDDTQALKEKITSLEAEIERLKGEKSAVESKLKTAETETANAVKEFKEFRAKFSTGNPPNGSPPAGSGHENIVRKPFKSKE